MRDMIPLMVKIPKQLVADTLCDALEGASNYWMRVEKLVAPRVWTWDDRQVFKTAEDAAAAENKHYQHCYPFNEGGALMVSDANADEPTLKVPVRLDIHRIYLGLRKWADDAAKPDDDKTRTSHPSHFGDFISGNGDGETADIFLQYCIFGEVIYG